MPDYLFRTLEHKDLEMVADFECEIAINSFGEDAVTDRSLYKKRLLPLVGAMGAFVAETDSGDIAGWALITSRANATSNEVYGDFRSYYIAPEHRGGRLAFSLITEVIEYGLRNEWSRIVGRTAATNKAMQSIYRFFDFEAKHIVYELSLDNSHSQQKSKKEPSSEKHRAHQKRKTHRKKGRSGS
ncbi:GNAT family N-acetyltransferase (plasmid) [Microbulbifer sp. MKSA007]|nr:GNAT family N-acetyltransferase [Microbulbifer sp. MKSA007]